ncbi:ADP-ribose pyrophosphatase [Pontibacillus halophilus JSM 076056 = DSM 19796]|uniref:ADP-ribose pyrophosphatase n=1 Tax=Pontibacillus halophilus JSM 076056 = DSM 19796 TaxID=1385510 RepID=A0A0A5GM43_9BACI|nr:NUDIX hydrolase [Pontibacillus halophilus]KGX92240.1 ADP-ribose pyrophosphatase [Pontibacillus halophilus JSM 076056 = DSM 19796]
MKKFEEKTIHTEQIYKGKVISLQVDDVTLPNGKTSKRELVKHPGAVAIIPITKEGKLVFVEQYRKALERSTLEIPAGKLEPGESPEWTAERELEEETGYKTAKLEPITSFSTSPGFADEIVHMFLARDLEVVDEKADGDEDEFVELVELTLDEAFRMEREGRIFDAKTAYSLLYVQAKGLV